MATYNIIVYTGSAYYAGTDAYVYLTLYGESRDSGEILLETESDDFESGA